MKYNNILESIGNTPHLRLSKLFPEHEVWIKLERFNPGGSIKDRIALAMINDAESKGLLKKGSTIIEPTSGNTGIGLSLVATQKGYSIIIVMPESMSSERQKYMNALGAKIILTPRELGMKGSIDKSIELSKEIKDSWIPQQFENLNNPKIHKLTTTQEILSDFPKGFDYFVAGVGTGGHLTGIGEALKEKFPNTKVVAVEPESSAILSGEKPSAHQIQGIGAGFIPPILNLDIIDQIEKISKEEAFDFTIKIAQTEGLLVGISTGAVLAAINRILEKENKNSIKKILTINYDTGERYFSISDLY